LTSQTWIFEDEDAPFGLLRAYQGAGLDHAFSNGIKTPQEGATGTAWLRRDQCSHVVPQSGEVLAVDLFVEGTALRSVLNLIFHFDPPCELLARVASARDPRSCHQHLEFFRNRGGL